MDYLLNGFNALSHGLIGYIIPFLFVLTIVVFLHELGHFLVARWCGVKVLTFSLGFGPELFGFNDRKGTRWKVSAIPLGGYVKFFGDESEASTPSSEALSKMTADEREGSFHHKKVGPRAAIVAAGPIANFLLAIVIFAAFFIFFGKPNQTARVDQVQAGSAAEKAGFKSGDVVTAIDGSAIENFSEMQRAVITKAGTAMVFSVKRGEQTVTLTGTPELREVKDAFGNVQRVAQLGISRATSASDDVNQKVNPVVALWLGTKESWFVTTSTLGAIYGMFAGQGGLEQIGGPLRIAQVSGQAASLGFSYLLQLTAVLSVSIGLLNLFPVPLLDGGHLLFYAVEAVRGRPLSERSQEMGFRVGLVMVLSLMVFAFYNDFTQIPALRRLFG